MTGMDTIAQTVIRTGHRLLVGWWFVTRPSTQGVKCVIVAESKVLLVQQSYGDRRWSVPGGGVKKSESFIEAAKRELREETSMQTALQHIGTYQQQIEYKNDTVEVFTGSFATVPEVSIDNKEIVAYEWFLVNQLPADCRPSVRKIISMYEKSQ